MAYIHTPTKSNIVYGVDHKQICLIGHYIKISWFLLIILSKFLRLLCKTAVHSNRLNACS